MRSSAELGELLGAAGFRADENGQGSMSTHRHIRRRESFDEVAELYDRARPGYPQRLIDDLVALTDLDKRCRVLEIGSGTGQLTVPLAERGLSVVAVELGSSLAEIARRKLAPFEHAEVVSPTSTSGYFQKCHSTWSWPRPPFIGSILSDEYRSARRRCTRAARWRSLKLIGVLVMATICFSQKANRATHVGTPTTIPPSGRPHSTT